MRGPVYTATFFRSEIERLTLLLTQGISPEQRVQYQHELASARSHLAELEG